MAFRLFKRSSNKSEMPDYWHRYLECFQSTYSNRTPIEEIRFVVFDTETTGLDIKKDHVLSIGAVGVKGFEIAIQDRLECYVRQEYEPSQEAVAVHGILSSHPATGLDALEAVKRFLQFTKDSVLVAHHAAFDVNMINRILKENGGGKLQNKVIDTGYLARRVTIKTQAERRGTYGLDNLCRLYHIPMSDRHTAAGDAFITAILLMKLLVRLKKRGVNTLGDLLRARRTL